MSEQCIYSNTCKKYRRTIPETICRKAFCCSHYFSKETYENNKKNLYYCLSCGRPLGFNLPEVGKLKLVPQHEYEQICSLCCQEKEERQKGSDFNTLDF